MDREVDFPEGSLTHNFADLVVLCLGLWWVA